MTISLSHRVTIPEKFLCSIRACCQDKMIDQDTFLYELVTRIIGEAMSFPSDELSRTFEKLSPYMGRIENTERRKLTEVIEKLFFTEILPQKKMAKSDGFAIFERIQFLQQSYVSSGDPREKIVFFEEAWDLEKKLAKEDECLHRRAVDCISDFSSYFCVVKAEHADICFLMRRVIEWMKSHKQKRVSEFLKSVLNFYKDNMTASSCFGLLEVVDSIHPMPKNILVQMQQIVAEEGSESNKKLLFLQFLEKNWNDILKNFIEEIPQSSIVNVSPQAAEGANLESIVLSPDSVPGSLIFSFLPRADRSALMKTCTAWKKVGELFFKGSEEEALKYLKNYYNYHGIFSLQNVPPYFRNNIQIALYALSLRLDSFADLGEELQTDPEIMRCVLLLAAWINIPFSSPILDKIPSDFKESSDIQRRIKNLKETGLPNCVFWRHFGPFVYAGSKHLPKLAYSHNMSEVIVHFPDCLKNDPEIKMIMLDLFQNSPVFLTRYVQKDREYFEAALRFNGDNLFYGSDTQKDDFSLVAQAVQQSGYALRYASDRLKNSPQIVEMAVAQNPSALEYASNALKDDPEFILLAIKKNPRIIETKEELGNNVTFVRQALAVNPEVFQYVNMKLQFDFELGKLAVALDPENLCYASFAVQTNRAIVHQAVQKKPSVVRHAAVLLENDFELAVLAVSLDPKLVSEIPSKFRKTPQILALTKGIQPQPVQNKGWTSLVYDLLLGAYRKIF